MLFILAAIILSLDQLSKFIVSKYLSLHQSIPVIKGIFHITLVHNRGAAFGILKDKVYIFIVISTAAILFIFLRLNKYKNNPPSFYNVSLSLILAGAVGNLIDRLFFGHVIDFLDFRIWPVFNIADSAITVGVIALGWDILKSKKVR